MTIYSGIYKWTNPKGRIYVGQSEDLFERKDNYKYPYKVIKQKRIYASIMKYGIDAHIFEVIELCCIEKLDERERHWQEYYDVLLPMGMNCILKETGEKRRVVSQKMKDKISKANTGKKRSQEARIRISEGQKKRVRSQEEIDRFKNLSLGRKCTEETKLKISIKNKGKRRSLKVKIILSQEEKEMRVKENLEKFIERNRGNKYNLGKIHSEETRKKISEANRGKVLSQEHKDKMALANFKPVIQLDKQENPIREWKSIREASDTLKIHHGNIGECCRNERKSAGKFRWKYKDINL